MSVFYLYTLCRAHAAAKQLAVNRREDFPSSPNNFLSTSPNTEPLLLLDLKSTFSVLPTKILTIRPSLHNEKRRKQIVYTEVFSLVVESKISLVLECVDQLLHGIYILREFYVIGNFWAPCRTEPKIHAAGNSFDTKRTTRVRPVLAENMDILASFVNKWISFKTKFTFL